jgi:tetratricopeptide (TPR) repeat protein
MENLKQMTLQQEVNGTLDTLARNPNNPSLYMPLFLRLFEHQAFPEAIQLLSFVVKQNPKDAFAQLNLGQLLELSGKLPEAEAVLQRALIVNPKVPELYLLLSQVLHKIGPRELQRAVHAAQEAVKYKPDYEDALLKLADLYRHNTSTLEKAEETLHRLIKLNPKHPSAHGLLGVIYLNSKRYKQAEETVHNSLESNQNNPAGYTNLSIIQSQLGKLGEAETNVRKAIALMPQFHKAHAQLGYVLYHKSQYAEAEAALLQSIKLLPDDLQTHMALAAVILARGDAQAAKTMLKDIFARTKSIDNYHQLLYAVWPILKTPAFINAVCDVSLEWRHGASEALAIKSIILNDLEDKVLLPKLCDFDTLVKTHKVSLPPSFANAEAFNHALTETIRNSEELVFEPIGRAIIRGYRLQPMAEEMNDATRALFSLFREAVARYADDLSASTNFPFLQPKPANHYFYAWGNIHKGEGYEFPHFHSDGWISGVYYPKLPAILEQENPGREGWLEFGTPRDDLTFQNTNWKTKAVKPEVGLLVLFPSYMWHRTIPYTGGDERVSIAFDAVPVR